MLCYNALMVVTFEGKYNPQTLVANLSIDPLIRHIDTFQAQNEIDQVLLVYAKPYGSGKLYMHRGDLRYFESLRLSRGQWALSETLPYVVIGDQVADALYHTLACIDRTLVLEGRSYRVKGIVKDSDDVYMGYDASLVTQDWHTKQLMFTPGKGMSQEAYLDLAKHELTVSRVAYTDVELIKWQFDIFRNIIVLIAIVVLVYVLMEWVRKAIKLMRFMVKDYYVKRYESELSERIKALSKEIKTLVLLMGGVMVILYACLTLAGLLRMSVHYLPENLLSPTSYYDLVKRHMEGILKGMRNGMSEWQIQSLLALFGEFFVTSLLALAYLIRKSWLEKHV